MDGWKGVVGLDGLDWVGRRSCGAELETAVGKNPALSLLGR